LIGLTPKQRDKLDARKRIVDFIQARLDDGDPWDEVERALQQHATEANWTIPGRRQLHRLVEASRKDQLAPGKPGWPVGRRRYIPEVRSAIEAVVSRLNAQGTRELTNLKTLLRLVNAEMRARGYEGPRDALGSRALKQFLGEFKAWGKDLASYLTRGAYRSITRVASKVMDASRPLEVVEIDALIPEFHVFDANGIDLGQPTIYVAIDVATGCVIGIKGYAMPPGVEPLLDFYEHLLFPKQPRPDGWEPPWGRPERILSDQGSEFRSSFAAGVAYTLGFQHLYAEGEAGWKKPHVERFNGELKSSFLHRIPGSTKSALTKKIDPGLAQRTGGITVEQLNDRIQAFAWDVHARTTSDRLRLKLRDPDATPALAWERLIADYPPMLPVAKHDFCRATHEFLAERQLAHDGVRYDNINYSSDALVAMYQQIGPQAVEVYGTPLDAGTIMIKHKASGASVTAKSKQQTAHGVPRRIWRKVAAELKLGRETADDHKAGLVLAQLINDTTAQVNDKKSKPRKQASAVAQSLSLAARAAGTMDTPTAKPSTSTESAAERKSTAAAPRPTTIVSFNPKSV
jgi:transposase InsO family protein